MHNLEKALATLQENKIIVVNKAIGPSSFAVVNFLRKTLAQDKAGHLGTLDPFAEGVLPIFFNKATNLLPYVENYVKTYRAQVILGCETDTLDISGALTKVNEFDFVGYRQILAQDAALIRSALKDFIGTNRQEIPLYSAKKVKGKKLYEYAREQVAVEKQYKTIEVSAANLLNWQGIISSEELATLALADLGKLFAERKAELLQQKTWPLVNFFPKAAPAPDAFTVNDKQAAEKAASFAKFVPLLYLDLEFVVSKGAFIRALVAELGKKLGLYATTVRLLRTAVGPFTLDKAWSETAIKQQLDDSLVTSEICFPLTAALANYPLMELESAEFKALAQGKMLSYSPVDKAAKAKFTTKNLLKKIRNFQHFSIIDNSIFLLAQLETTVVGMLKLSLAEGELFEYAESLRAEGIKALAEATLTIKAGRMLVSGENL